MDSEFPTMPDEKMQRQIRFFAGLLLFLNIVFGVYMKWVSENTESATRIHFDIFAYGPLLLGGLSFIMAFVCWFTQSGQKIERAPRFASVNAPKLGLGTALFIFSLFYFFLGLISSVGRFL